MFAHARMKAVINSPPSECVFVLQLVEDTQRLRSVPLPTLLHCGATLNRAMGSMAKGPVPTMTEIRKCARLMSVRATLVAEIRRRSLASPPPDAA